MPGRLPSLEPAIEGPARMKAKARMKLKVRICRSPVGAALGALSLTGDNPELFREFCAKSEKWFRRRGEMFLQAAPTKQFD